MGMSRHTEVQIIASLKQIEAGGTADNLARALGTIDSGSFSGMGHAALGNCRILAVRMSCLRRVL
jgi:hypothetical protein